jgi:hypothetical protein
MIDNDETLIPRILGVETLLRDRSVPLFGPRQTGKSTNVRRQIAGKAIRERNRETAVEQGVGSHQGESERKPLFTRCLRWWKRPAKGKRFIDKRKAGFCEMDCAE